MARTTALDFGASERWITAWARLMRASGRPTNSTACAAAVSPGQAYEVVLGGLGEVGGAAQATLIGERAADDLAELVVAERLQGEQERAGQQRADDGEEGVLGGRADERHPAVLHGGQQ